MIQRKDEIFIALKDAFPHTIPIMMGYLLMGFAFGVLLDKSGYDFVWAFFMSVFIYAGAMQFVAIGLLASGIGIWSVVVLSAMVNARQIFYSISMLDRFSKMGKKLPYMIHSLTDETFALFNVKKPQEGTNETYFMFFIALLNHIYWIIGSLAGSLIGSKFSFDSRGVDFVMTAIFMVIFMEQWKHSSNHTPAIVGIFTSVICLLLWGGSFLLPSLVLMTFILMLLRKKLEC
ncbi:AzlC family ABC transporter permease [Helicobacter cappadocius]|uniref:AzlC family ABC transporter permease n=1 Tax=Helicobacter cappadocius TaxID=3063998 RepID=A0AA90PIS2_9HELI|nr:MULTISPECIES: AzlC family ABC transporter permease [unclassified Helicobacter]MDO7252983.1 AzlC family ABC transporter permease [Helicobacter sp. faydin-H75]MDP2539027.1 AzlC family ABC transporter permease [Helicobacter sp. faydin-H76]